MHELCDYVDLELAESTLPVRDAWITISPHAVLHVFQEKGLALCVNAHFVILVRKGGLDFRGQNTLLRLLASSLVNKFNAY